MTNPEYLCKNEPIKIAMAFIKETEGYSIVETPEGALYKVPENVYVTSDGEQFAVYDTALQHQIEWLNAEGSI